MTTPWHDSFRPLHVTAWLSTNVVSDEYLPLDGIIRDAAMFHHFGFKSFSLPGGEIENPNLPPRAMPLDKRVRGNIYYYACSFAYPQPWWITEGIDHWNKRFDFNLSSLIDFNGKRGTVNVQSARYRAYHMPIYYRVTRKIEWFCFGEKDLIGKYLALVTHIGKKRSQGWGRVARWEVNDCQEDWSEMKNGKPMRALPANSFPEEHQFKVRHYAVRPPYYTVGHFKPNQMLCVVP